MDIIVKEALEKSENLYSYRNLVTIPPLEKIDDIITINTCGIDSLCMNIFVNKKVEMKKLKLNEGKCKKIHIGKNDRMCPDLMAHEEVIKDTENEKYIGDIISKDCTNKKNTLLDEVRLGVHYFEGEPTQESICDKWNFI